MQQGARSDLSSVHVVEPKQVLPAERVTALFGLTRNAANRIVCAGDGLASVSRGECRRDRGAAGVCAAWITVEMIGQAVATWGTMSIRASRSSSWGSAPVIWI